MQIDKDSLAGLLALKLVVEKKSFSAAADALSVSAPAVSKTIRQLESKIGKVLLNRTTRSLSLTEEGSIFVTQIGPHIDSILAALESVKKDSSEITGHLRLNMPSAFYPHFLERHIDSFRAKHPSLLLEIFLEDAKTDIVADGFDAGVRSSEVLANDMIAIKLFGPIKYRVVATPKYLAKHGRPKHPRDLLDHACVATRTGPSLYEKWEFELKGKPFQVQVRPKFIINDGRLLVKEGLKGNGMIYINEDAVANELRTGKLEAVLTQFSPSSDGYYLYYTRSSQSQPKLRALIDHIKSSIRKEVLDRS